MSPLVLFWQILAVFCTEEFITQFSAVFLSTLVTSLLFKKGPNENESNHSVGSGLISIIREAMAAAYKWDFKKWTIFYQLWRNMINTMEGVKCWMLGWKYTPLYEKEWKKPKNVVTETTTKHHNGSRTWRRSRSTSARQVQFHSPKFVLIFPN